MAKTFLSLLPCGMVNPFRQAMQAFLAAHADRISPEEIGLEGNVNHEKSYYPAVEASKSADEFPDLLLGSDIGNLFHRPFRERFVETGHFRACFPHGRNPGLQRAGFFDPQDNYTMFSANLLVIVADLARLGNRNVPQRWEDLLDPQYRKSIAIRGDDDFFCNGVLLPMAQRFGMPAMSRLAANVAGGMHPAQMAKLAGGGNEDAPAIYVMPAFFADKIMHKATVRIVWPEEGAIPSPVYVLAKKDAPERHPLLADHLFSLAMAQVFTRNGFPAAHPQADDVLHDRPLFWIGWNFLLEADVGAYKDDVQRAFLGAL